jgi:hypothetical protein
VLVIASDEVANLANTFPPIPMPAGSVRDRFNTVTTIAGTPTDIEWAGPSLAATAVDQSAAHHLDLAAASAGLAWWADKWGRVQTSYYHSSGVLDLSAYPDPMPGWVELHDLEVATDTDDTVNRVLIRNHTTGVNEVTGETEDVTEETSATAPASITDWGSHHHTIDTNLPPGQVSARAQAILTEWSTPVVRVRAASYDGLRHLTHAHIVDVGATARVKAPGFFATAMITGTRHHIDPDEWTTTLELRQRFITEG